MNDNNDFWIGVVAIPILLVVAAVGLAVILGIALLLAAVSPVLAGMFLGWVIYKGLIALGVIIGTRYFGD